MHKFKAQHDLEQAGQSTPRQSEAASGQFEAAPGLFDTSNNDFEPEVTHEFTVGMKPLTKQELDKVWDALQTNTRLDAAVPQHLDANYKV